EQGAVPCAELRNARTREKDAVPGAEVLQEQALRCGAKSCMPAGNGVVPEHQLHRGVAAHHHGMVEGERFALIWPGEDLQPPAHVCVREKLTALEWAGASILHWPRLYRPCDAPGEMRV